MIRLKVSSLPHKAANVHSMAEDVTVANSTASHRYSTIQSFIHFYTL